MCLILFIQVSDAANVMGLAHAENIQVQAEAYDVALDISFPKGKKDSKFLQTRV